MSGVRQQSNFSQLKAHDEQLERLGLLAERYFADDPNTCLLKLRQLAEAMAQSVASRVGLYTSSDERQIDLLRRLQDHGIVPREIGGLFHEIRKAGNDANHNLGGDHRTALMAMRLAWQLGIWFHRTFKDPGFKSGPFIPPSPPVDESADLKAELDALQRELLSFRTAHQGATQALVATQARAQQTEEERAFWEAMAAEAETARHEMAQRLEAIQAQASAQPPQAVARLVEAANTAAATVKLSEADTRKIIDEQLATAGWTVDSTRLTFTKGARPQRGRNMAIAEWPTETGPSDYVLFIGLQPVAVIEAKRKHLDVSAVLQQAKRYSRSFKPSSETELPAANYGAKLEAIVDVDARKEYIKNHSTAWAAVREYLSGMSSAKCWYSEARESVSRYQVDHFRPHGRAKQAAKDYAEGYSWLAFDLDNFRLAGLLCNTVNKEYSEESVGKGDWFPLADPSKRACLGARDLSAESPILLAPTDPDDPCKLWFNDDGTVVPDQTLDDGTKAAVETAIQYLGLGQSMLIRQRNRVLHRCRRAIHRYKSVFKKPKGARTEVETQNMNEARSELLAMSAASGEFAAAVRCCLIAHGLRHLVIQDEMRAKALPEEVV